MHNAYGSGYVVDFGLDFVEGFYNELRAEMIYFYGKNVSEILGKEDWTEAECQLRIYQWLCDEIANNQSDQEITLPIKINGEDKEWVLELMLLNDEGDSDTISTGCLYGIFPEEDLFTMTPTPFKEALEQVGIVPEFAQWSVLC